MENFLGSNPEILNDETGSNELPKLVTVSNGKNRGYNFVTKISTMFYKGVKSNTVKRDGSLNIRCSHHRTGCQWTGRVLNKSGISADLPEFWLNQEIYQVLIISIQFFNEDHDKTHCQPLIACLLPNKKESTYNKAFEEIKEIYHDQTGYLFTIISKNVKV